MPGTGAGPTSVVSPIFQDVQDVGEKDPRGKGLAIFSFVTLTFLIRAGMELRDIVLIDAKGPAPTDAYGIRNNRGSDFRSFIKANSPIASENPLATASPYSLIPEDFPLGTEKGMQPGEFRSVYVYEKEAFHPSVTSGWAKYKDDQLLSNPGGDHYYLTQGKARTDTSPQEDFKVRVGKDISDAFANFRNLIHDLLLGSKIHYRNEKGQISEAGKRGLTGLMVDFVKDMGSAFTFGQWRPDGEKEPKGLLERMGFFCSKAKEAVFGDLIQGATSTGLQMGEDLALAGWNLLEVLPDATIGNTEAGRDLTTSLFDNGQVAIDYMTDVLPGGEAWVRVHSPDLDHLENPKAPVFNNLEKPERSRKDERWTYVRNTPFRKAIETVGSLLSDFLAVKFIGKTKYFSERDHHERN